MNPIVKTFYNGAIYGAQVRFPHALVMTLMFSSGTLKEKLRAVLSLTLRHSANLALFASCYTICRAILQRWCSPAAAYLLSGGLCGGLLLGENTTLLNHVNLYTSSRVVLACTRWAIEKWPSLYFPGAFRLYSALSYGALMLFFEMHPKHLQKSLQTSMNFIYR